MSLGESIKFSAFIRNEAAMTEPPKDYEEREWWRSEPESVASHRQTLQALGFIAAIIVGFLIGVAI